MFYLTKEDWEMYILPKLNEARTFLNEFKYLKKIYSTMKFIISNLKIYNQIVLSTSMIYYHQYCVLQDFNLTSLENYHKFYFISACLFIATKSTNHLVSINQVIKIIQQIFEKKFPEKKILDDEIKNNILNYELKILDALGFNLNIETPYKFFGVIKQYLITKQDSIINHNINKLIEVLNCYINDTFILPLHLYFTPNVIAISSFLVLKNYLHLDSINLKEIMNLSEYLIDINEVNECYNLFRKIYIDESQLINSKSDSLKSLSTTISKNEEKIKV
jgi:hypothetical protein